MEIRREKKLIKVIQAVVGLLILNYLFASGIFAQNGPIALWKFDQDTVDFSNVYDSVGGNHGERYGTTLVMPGKVGDGTLWFAGADCTLICDGEPGEEECWWECEDEEADNIIVPHNYTGNLDPGTGSFSITLWVKPEEIEDNRLIWKNDGMPCVLGYYLMQAKYSFSFGVGDSLTGEDYCEYDDLNGWVTNKAEVVGGQISDQGGFEQWYFVAGVIDKDSGHVILYVNGEEVGRLEDPTLNVFCENTLAFGWQPSVAQEAFRGSLDEIAFYDRALSQEEILEQYCSIESCDVPPPEMADNLLEDVENLNLPNNIENSYLANLKKVRSFIDQGKITPAILQLNAFIGKVEQDMVHGNINQQIGNNLIKMANELIAALSS